MAIDFPNPFGGLPGPFQDNPKRPAYGSQQNPSNYFQGDPRQSLGASAFGGPGQIFGGGQVPMGGINLPFFLQDRERLGGMLNGQSPFAGSEWGGLISQLQNTAAGRGPSVAGDAYRQASMDNSAALASMGQASNSPAAARQAMLQQQRVGQGLAGGYAQARNQEMLGAQNALSGALGARDQLNQGAYLNILAQQLGLNQQQLQAAMANQQFALGSMKNENDLTAAKWGAISGILGGVGSMVGGGRRP